MTKIDIFSGFLGAGKTTLIKKLIAEAYTGEKLVLIENEFGEIGIDGGFMKDAGINVTEMNSGCICCSLVGDFSKALKEVEETYHPDRILIEPSGVGKLSDVVRAVERAEIPDAVVNSCTTVVDAVKCKMYMKNFGEFFNNQVEHAACIVLSHTDKASEEKIEACIAELREHNPSCEIVTTPWNAINGKQILDAMEQKNSLAAVLEELKKAHVHDEEEEHEHHHHDDEEEHEHHHHHHDDDEEEHERHHHHHDDDEEEHEHHHCHHHDDDEEEHEHHHCHHHDDEEEEHEYHHCHHHGDDDEEEHEHHHDGECCHHHHHHHGHDADEIFTSWGKETAKTYTADEISEILKELSQEEVYGNILRAKGMVAGENGWIHFDYVPGGIDVRSGAADVIGKICVIGCNIKEDELGKLFRLA